MGFEDDLYVDEDSTHEMQFGNSVIKIKELPGEEFMSLLPGGTPEEARDVDVAEVARKAIPACVVEPEDIDPKKLKATVEIKLIRKIMDIHGLTEEVQQDFLER